MKVLKFGGTSVGSVESLRNVKKIVDSIPGRAVIVVSALGGLTDKLISTARLAEAGDSGWIAEMESIRARHHAIIEEMVPDHLRKDVEREVDSLLDSLSGNYEGVALLRSLPEKTLDNIVSFGERISSWIVAALVENGKRYYSPDFIKTEKRYGKNIIAANLTEEAISDVLGMAEENEKSIVPGFISSDSSSGDITNLGRGGSDYTGALIAASLGAEVLEIWTDVDGFMTADPRVVKDALVINHLTFTESMELCTFGAKVVYPPTIYPVFHKNIPIRILNTFNPGAPGTYVTDHPHHDDFDVKGVTAHKDISLLTIKIESQKINSLDPLHNLSHRALNALTKKGVNILPLLDHDETGELKLGVNSSDSERALEAITSEFSHEISAGKLSGPELTTGLCAVAVVGKEMRRRGRLTARIRHSLLREGIEVPAFSEGSDTTAVFLIYESKTAKALVLIHSLIF